MLTPIISSIPLFVLFIPMASQMDVEDHQGEIAAGPALPKKGRKATKEQYTTKLFEAYAVLINRHKTERPGSLGSRPHRMQMTMRNYYQSSQPRRVVFILLYSSCQN